ncbi:hypothetical protein FOCC_FOCC008753 [Frankliniella occidentalis]|nr:hypothetical protein FOCC_FOCC008753 [Frankliniella occidentalis]
MHIALALLCICLLALAVAAVNRRRIAKFMNSGDDGWDSETAVRCSVAGEDARTIGTPLGLMWGDYDSPPSPVAVGLSNGVVRDPLAEQLAAQTSDPEHIYQEIRPHGHQNGGPVVLRGLRASSDAFQ